MAKVALISCVSKKLAHPAPADELYVSDLFKKNLAYAKSLKPDAIYILSAKCGLLGLDKKVKPYEQTLNTMKDKEVRAWAGRVLAQIKGEGIDFKKDKIIFLAGERYRKYLLPHFARASVPLKGLGIGRQLAFLKRALSDGKKDNCAQLHAWARSLKRFSFPFDSKAIPSNGIYLLFEKGEASHKGNSARLGASDRIVRAGTHTGEGQLPSRLRQHFLAANKDRSILRKNIGRALLNKKRDPYLAVWELDFTPALARKKHGTKLDAAKQTRVEKEVTDYVQKNFSFAVVPVDDKARRLSLESKIISTLSHCGECAPSKGWLGNYSPKEKIRKSGLWLVNELYKTPLAKADLVYLQSL